MNEASSGLLRAVGAADGDAYWFLGTLMIIKATGEDTGGAFSLFEQLAPLALVRHFTFIIERTNHSGCLKGACVFAVVIGSLLWKAVATCSCPKVFLTHSGSKAPLQHASCK